MTELYRTNDNTSRLTSVLTERIQQKIDRYNQYRFTSEQDCALKTFFDLAQEFDGKNAFCLISVLIPKLFFQLNSRIYLLGDDGFFRLSCSGENDSTTDNTRRVLAEQDIEHLTYQDGCYRILINANMQQLSSLEGLHKNGILGVFEIETDSVLSVPLQFFFEKYVNRIGYQLHNRIIAEKNREHIQFIKNLVADIGHNVIVPNIYFKLFYRRLKGKINRARAISESITKLPLAQDIDPGKGSSPDGTVLIDELKYITESMESQFEEIIAHYEQTSLFLETLLRQSHFEEGRYVIEPKRINFREKIIRPQLNRFIPRLKERGIEIDVKISGIPNEEIPVVADEGLISQAYANLFSNAEKYTREVIDNEGNPQKFVAIGMEILANYFGIEKDGIKFNVFSTGPHIPPEDVPRIFDEGYRGHNTKGEYGTGHGLQFVRDVLELHNGDLGYEATPMGNNFYFVLPK